MAKTMDGMTKTRLTGTSIIGKEKEMIKTKEKMKKMMLSEIPLSEKERMLKDFFYELMPSYFQEYMKYLTFKQDYIDNMLEKGEGEMSEEDNDAWKQMIINEKTFLDEEEKMLKNKKEMYEEMTRSRREPENLKKLELFNILIDMNSFKQNLTDLELNEKSIQTEKDVSQERKKWKETVKSRKYDLQGKMEERPRRYFRLEKDMDDFRHDMANLLQEKNEGKLKSYELEKKIKQMKIDLMDKEMKISDDTNYEEHDFYRLNKFGLKRKLKRLEQDMICDEFNTKTLRIKHEKEDDILIWKYSMSEHDTNVRLQKCYVDVNNVIIEIDEHLESFQPELKVKLELEGLIKQEATIFDKDSRTKLRQEWKLLKELYDQEDYISCLERENKEMMKERIKEVKEKEEIHFTDKLFEQNFNLKEVELKITKNILESNET